jgi:hypothetical protein
VARSGYCSRPETAACHCKRSLVGVVLDASLWDSFREDSRRVMHYDVFISHAAEDKVSVARPLAARLEELGLKVWVDVKELTLGDSLRHEIDVGVKNSDFGVVILSESFFKKPWAQRELGAFFAIEDDSRKVVLPVCHGLSVQELKDRSPLLAARLTVSTDKGLDSVASEIFRAVRSRPANDGTSGAVEGDEHVTTEFKQGPVTPGSRPKLDRYFLLVPIIIIGTMLVWWFRPRPCDRGELPPASTLENAISRLTDSERSTGYAGFREAYLCKKVTWTGRVIREEASAEKPFYVIESENPLYSGKNAYFYFKQNDSIMKGLSGKTLKLTGRIETVYNDNILLRDAAIVP